MEALLQSWLDELRSDGLHLAAEDFAGANENLWCISVSADQPIAGADLLAFLRDAVVIRRDVAARQRVRPVTFYAWHDEMAGQLRFSTARCTRDTLPFHAKVVLVDDPSAIVAAFARSVYRVGIPLNELQDSTLAPARNTPFTLEVWAVELCPVAF